MVDAMGAPDVGKWLDEALDGRRKAADGIADVVMAIELAAGDGGAASCGIDAAAASVAHAARRAAASPVPSLIAAAMFLLIRAVRTRTSGSRRAPSPRAERRAPVPAPTVQPEPSPSSLMAVAQQAANAGLGVEVDEIDSPAHDVTVFEIPRRGSLRRPARRRRPAWSS